MRIIPLSMLLSILFIPSLCSAYSLDDAINSALNNNNKIKSAREEFRNADTKKLEALTTLLPNVALNSNFSKTEAKTAIAIPFEDPHSRTNELKITQPLFTGGSSIFSMYRAKNISEAARASLHGTKEDILVSTVAAYENLLAAREIVNFSNHTEQALEKLLTGVQISFESGEATLTDVAQAKARLASATAEKIKAMNELMNAEAFFFHIIGERTPQTLEEISLNRVAIPKGQDQLLAAALSKNPNIRQAKSEFRAARHSKSLAIAQLSPQVAATASYVRTDRAKTINRPDSDTYTIGVQVPIFQSGAEYVGIKSASHLQHKADYDYKEIKHAVREAATKAWSEYISTKSQINATTEAVDFAERALLGMQEEFKAGTRSTIDVLDAESELLRTKINNRVAKRDNTIAVFKMHALMGSLNNLFKKNL